MRTVLNGMLEQEIDLKTDGIADMETVTKVEPTDEQKLDLEFAGKLVKHRSEEHTSELQSRRNLVCRLLLEKKKKKKYKVYTHRLRVHMRVHAQDQ